VSATLATYLKPDPSEAEDRLGPAPEPADTPAEELATRWFDPTQGRQIGAYAYDDPTQGRQVGSRPYDDPTWAGRRAA
jgi:hypothetical protein